MIPVRCHSSRAARLVPLPLNRQSGFHNFSAIIRSVRVPRPRRTAEAQPCAAMVRRAQPSGRSRRWGNESSGKTQACLVITFLTDRRARFEDQLADSPVRSKAFARPGFVIGRVPRSGVPRATRFEGHRPDNDHSPVIREDCPRGSRCGSFRRRRDIIGRRYDR